ncbi:hypothetical protein BC628DRAFT_1419049 [Trametes gibbosa]|nr:hypothetical protein BC628DRAFT_1419049 [Trametes gibbosa]
MEYWQARLDSFGSTKLKRSKASSSKQASSSAKWPHPPTWKATPNSLAEAGFYYNPSPGEPDNVTCFMCKKSLCGWEPEDDPFEIHHDKCSQVCAWAVVRCQKPDASGSYDSSDSTRHPTSKSMEKARLDTFAKVEWPHDSEKGHGANSKALAKAGFVWNALEPGDDTAICLYCNLSLGGWDAEDDPYKEHLKRDTKHKTACAFLRAYASNTLGKSTSKRPPSKVVSRSLSRSASQTIQSVAEPDEDSEDELAVAPSSGNAPPRSSGIRASKSRSSRASSAPAKTPASRRSTRGTGANSKTPGSRNTVSSEVEETDAGSEGETGRKASKSKRKTGGRTKARVSAIVEEVEDEAPRRVQSIEDVEMQEDEKEKVPVKKRGRPPKNAAATKPAPKSRSKKVVDPEETEDVAETDNGPPLPHPKKAHTRTRSKANLESESEAVAQSTSKPTHTRTKSAIKAKIKEEEAEEQVPAPKRKGKQKAAPVPSENGEDDDLPLPSKPNGKASAAPRSKVKPEPELSVEDYPVPSQDVVVPEPRMRTQSSRSTSSRPPRVPSQRTPSLSDDAGYATAEPPADAMDIDNTERQPPQPPQQNSSRKASLHGTQPTQQREASPSTLEPTQDDAPKRPSPISNVIVRGSSAVPSSRASSTRTLTRVSSQRFVNKDALKVIDIDSDGEEGASREQQRRKPKAVERTVSLGGMKPPSKTPGKKLQVEVLLPTRPKAPPRTSEDVPMHEPSRVSPVRGKVTKSPSSPQVVTKSDPPGTPVSAVHRSTQVSPVHPPPAKPRHTDEDVAMGDSDPAVVAPTSPRTYHPVLAQVPIEKLTNLTEEEAGMTLEEYIRRETALQYAQFKADAERRIEEFKQKAAEARKLIETS